MADGGHKAITALRAGDLVLTKDGPYRARAVRPSGVRPVGRLHLGNGMSVRCTPDHPIFTQRGWVNAGDLAGHDLVAVLRRLAPHESEDLVPIEVYGEALGESLTKAYATVEAGGRAPRIPWKRAVRRGTRAPPAPRVPPPPPPPRAPTPLRWSPPRAP